jgi:Uma2 family endonuclease
MSIIVEEEPSDPTDPTIYRVSDDEGEHEIQTYILEILRPLVERYVKSRGVVAHVGSSQFFYWVKYDPTHSFAPDLYVLPGVSQSVLIGVWKVWERKVVPSFVLEVVDGEDERDAEREYLRAPLRCTELGVRELVIFDPFPGPRRFTFQVYRWDVDSLVRVEETQRDRVWSNELGCFIRAVGTGMQVRLRLGVGANGDDLFPTAQEAVRLED